MIEEQKHATQTDYISWINHHITRKWGKISIKSSSIMRIRAIQTLCIVCLAILRIILIKLKWVLVTCTLDTCHLTTYEKNGCPICKTRWAEREKKTQHGEPTCAWSNECCLEFATFWNNYHFWKCKNAILNFEKNLINSNQKIISGSHKSCLLPMTTYLPWFHSVVAEHSNVGSIFISFIILEALCIFFYKLYIVWQNYTL